MNSLRKYRIDIEHPPFLNSDNTGIALLDLIFSFIGAYILDKFFNISIYFKNKTVYYLSIIPIGIIFHLIFHQNTFLNNKLISSSFNIYHIIIIIIFISIYLNWH